MRLDSIPRWARAPRALAVSLSLLFPARAAAQRVVGTVVHLDGRTPAAGVIVVARDTAGRELSQAVTGAEGQFTLFVDSAITLSLRLFREGFAPTDGETRRLAGDEIVDLIAVLGNAPVPRLPLPRGASSCGRATAEQRAAVELLLEEARKAFIAAPVEPALARTPFGIACPERLGRPNTGAAQGAIPPKDSASLAGILVRVTWDDPVVVDRTIFTKREQVREALTDDAGAFLICDLPTRRDLTLRRNRRPERTARE